MTAVNEVLLQATGGDVSTLSRGYIMASLEKVGFFSVNLGSFASDERTTEAATNIDRIFEIVGADVFAASPSPYLDNPKSSYLEGTLAMGSSIGDSLCAFALKVIQTREIEQANQGVEMSFSADEALRLRLIGSKMETLPFRGLLVGFVGKVESTN